MFHFTAKSKTKYILKHAPALIERLGRFHLILRPVNALYVEGFLELWLPIIEEIHINKLWYRKQNKLTINMLYWYVRRCM